MGLTRGLRCNRCGDCCRVIYIPVHGPEDGHHDWLSYHGYEVIKRGGGWFLVGGECDKLDGDDCVIYGDRPGVCRAYKCVHERDFVKT